MSFPISAGVYTQETDNSYVVGAVANSIGGIVINSDKGTTGAIELITNSKQFLDTFGTPVPTKPSMYSALAFLQQGQRLLVTRAVGTGAVKSTLAVNDNNSSPLLAFTVNAVNEGVWGDDIKVFVSTQIESATVAAGGTGHTVGMTVTLTTGTGTSAQFLVDAVDGSGIITSVSMIDSGLYSVSPTLTASATDITGVTLDLVVSQTFTLGVQFGGEIVETFLTSRDPLQKDGFGKSMYIEDVINDNSVYISVVDNDILNPFNGVDRVAPIASTNLASGNNGATPTSAEINTAWDLYSNKDEVEVSILINGGWASPEVQIKMIALAESRTDCFAVLDFPSDKTTVAESISYRKATLNANTSYGALYAGFVKIYDQFNGKNITLPPSGYVAGVYAKTAQVSEVWYAPAGERRGVLNVLGVHQTYTEGERDSLYSAGINPIQNFVGSGIQIYGQKTLQTASSALDRINVRMLLITVEKAVSKALKPFVFEFNDLFSRQNVESIINSYMDDIKVRRGVYDYLTVVDETNNTPQVIDNNQMLVDLYVKPTRVAEFIKLNVIVSKTGATFKVS